MTRLELFYDLIFVFAFLNVTDLVARELTVMSALSGLVVLALLWFCWTVFGALGNIVRTDHGVLPLFGFAIMAAVFVLALAIPQAFVDQPGNLSGPGVFAICYLTVRALTTIAFLFIFGGVRPNRWQRVLVTVPPLLAAVLVGVATIAPRWLPAEHTLQIRLGLWTAALVVEYAVGFALPYARWSVVSAGHWAERHALIVLIALGEAVISLGLGPGRFEDLALNLRVVVAAVLGIALIAALWWLHFDTLAPAVEQALHGTRGPLRIPLARDAFTYLYLLLIIGIVATALGLKLVLKEVAAPGIHPPRTPTVITLYGGVALYLLAGAAIGMRTFRRLRPSKLVAVVLICALIVPASQIAPLFALGVLVAVCIALALVQRFTSASARERIKRAERQEEEAMERALSDWRRQHL